MRHEVKRPDREPDLVIPKSKSQVHGEIWFEEETVAFHHGGENDEPTYLNSGFDFDGTRGSFNEYMHHITVRNSKHLMGNRDVWKEYITSHIVEKAILGDDE